MLPPVQAIHKVKMKDLRSPLAKARDKFLESEEGLSITEPSILSNPDQKQYLINRIQLAFLAGVEAQEKLEKK